MLLRAIIVTLLQTVLCVDKTVKDVTDVKEVKQVKPYVFPIPFELPNRNDKAKQCWLRIEDVELIETVVVYCYIAQGFLSNYIHDYNSRKMTEDDVDVSLWIEKPRVPEENITPPETKPHSIKDWRTTTLMDPTINRRLYISKNADCRLVMYSREGTTNYLVDCEKILFYINVRMSGSAVFSFEQNLRLIIGSLFLVYFLRNI